MTANPAQAFENWRGLRPRGESRCAALEVFAARQLGQLGHLQVQRAKVEALREWALLELEEMDDDERT